MDLTALKPVEPAATTPAGERVLTAASHLFYRRGIHAVGVDLIAETAGVTKRTLYQRFGSKEALAVAYLQARAARWQRMLLEALDQPSSGADGIRMVFEAAARWARDNPRGCAFVNAWGEIGGSDHPAVGVIAAEKTWMRTLFTILTGDADTARAVHLLYEGAHVSATTLGEADAYDEAGRVAMTLVR
ncbi:TetR/AcrR family transcriptional regulator [Gordonia sinesedis]